MQTKSQLDHQVHHATTQSPHFLGDKPKVSAAAETCESPGGCEPEIFGKRLIGYSPNTRSPVVTDMIVNAAAGRPQSHKPLQTHTA